MLNIQFNNQLCVVCSAGGHLTEAISALSKVQVPMYFVTYGEPHVRQRLAGQEAYYVKDPHISLWGYIVNLGQSIKILWKKKPKVIFTTGAGIALATCILGKIMGAKIVFLESGARISTASKTGILMYYIADSYLVQWKPLLKLFPKATYVGTIVMILLLLGTNPYPFNRLLNAVDTWAISSGQQVIAQTGHTPVEGISSIECHDFVDYEQILDWIKESEYVICQGGFGSLKDCINMQKSVIAVPRMQEFGECKDSQAELVDALGELGQVISLHDVDRLHGAINKVHQFKAQISSVTAVPDVIAKIVDNYFGDKK